MRNYLQGAAILVALSIAFGGCHIIRRAGGHPERAIITISNDWVEEGEDEIVFLEEGDARIAVPLRDERSIKVHANSVMKRFALSFTQSGRFIEFYAGLRPGHTYAIRCSPCCLLRIDDENDDPYEFHGAAVFTDEQGECPPGMIALYPGLAEDPEGKHRCVPAPRIRFRISGEVLQKGPVVAELGEAMGNEPIGIQKEETEYFSFDIARSGAPFSVMLFQNGQLLWEGMIIFRVKHSYSFEYNPSSNKPVSIYLDD